MRCLRIQIYQSPVLDKGTGISNLAVIIPYFCVKSGKSGILVKYGQSFNQQLNFLSLYIYIFLTTLLQWWLEKNLHLRKRILKTLNFSDSEWVWWWKDSVSFAAAPLLPGDEQKQKSMACRETKQKPKIEMIMRMVKQNILQQLAVF